MNPLELVGGFALWVGGWWLWWRFMRYLLGITLSGMLIERRARQLHREGKMLPSDRPGTWRR